MRKRMVCVSNHGGKNLTLGKEYIVNVESVGYNEIRVTFNDDYGHEQSFTQANSRPTFRYASW